LNRLLTKKQNHPAVGEWMNPATLTFYATFFCIFGATPVFSQTRDVSQGFEKCKIIADDQARLNCLKNLLPSSSSDSAASVTKDPWPLVRTPNPKGGADAIAIMRTADTALSDPDLAGLMIRCAEKPSLEVLLVLVRPFPPRTKTDVVVTSGTTQSVLQAEAASPGSALVLPIEATAFTSGPWQGSKELAVAIRRPEAEIRGVIPLNGVTSAIAKLSSSCSSG
jgi:hypothetical protein